MAEEKINKDEVELKIIRKADFIADSHTSLHQKAEKILKLLLDQFNIRSGAIVCHDPFRQNYAVLAERGELNEAIVKRSLKSRSVVTGDGEIAYPIKIRTKISGVSYLSGREFGIREQEEIGSAEKVLDGTVEHELESSNLENLFKKYVDEKVIAKLIDHPKRAHIEGERHNCSILFADLGGFTEYSNTHKPEEVIMLLNHFYSEMSEIAFKHDGTVDKFIGDEIMIVFGTPLPLKNHATRAIICALKMLNNSKKIVEKFNLPGGLSIGIATGRVIAGDVGSSQMKDYTVVGNKVNLASRLTSQAGRNEIIVDQETKDDASKYQYERVDVGEIQGFGKGVRTYKVITPKL